jgi:hypothetical protein
MPRKKTVAFLVELLSHSMAMQRGIIGNCECFSAFLFSHDRCYGFLHAYYITRVTAANMET